MPKELSALAYHRGTNHPDGELLDYSRGYHPGMRPTLFKRYRGLPTVELEVGKPAPEPPALSAIGNAGAPDDAPGRPPRRRRGAERTDASAGDGPAAQLDLERLARLLHYSAGITKHLRGYAFRAAACTGALYHIELYVVCGELEGLVAGVYHYDPEQSRLVRLREGDFRGALVGMSGGARAVRGAPATLVYSDVFWRNAIKYQAREFRHAFWDSGTIAANTLSIAASLRVPAQLVMGFVDDEVAQLLGLDQAEELPLALLALGSGAAVAAQAGRSPEPIQLDWEPRTEGSRVFPTVPRVHRASALDSADQVRAWRRAAEGEFEAGATAEDEAEPAERGRRAKPGGTHEGAPATQPGDGTAELRLEPPERSELPRDSLERVILQRGSSRAFTRQPIERWQLAALLDRALRPLPANYPRPEPIVRPYLIVNAVTGLEPGAYQLREPDQAGRVGLRLVRAGEFRRQAAELALGQALGGDAAADLYLMSPLERVLARYGERGYRLAQMEAAVMAGWGYLAAYALGFGATGLTFYDELVEEFLGVSEGGLKVMFLLAIGVPARG